VRQVGYLQTLQINDSYCYFMLFTIWKSERFPERNYSTGKAYFYNIISTFFRRSFATFQQEHVRRSLIQTCTPNGHLYRLTYTRCRIDTTNSPDDGHMAARNM